MNEKTKSENKTMKTKIEIKSMLGDILFEYEKENNSIKDTLIEAVKSGANLCGANLYGANLYGANLYGANLRDAELGEWGKINNPTDILIVGKIGSRNDYTAIFRTYKGVFVSCGCFRGTLDKFESEVKETHKGNKHERDYLALIQFVKIKFEI